ncbi:MAG: sugar transferase [Dysgonamonadaceae bacterium]|nr:sugar transferase [Dysgonamonadaceae bacterium]
MIFKHLFDKVFSFTGLLILAPVLLVISILITVKMPDGPVIFRQKRVGKHGKLFTMYKFRTMTHNHSGSSISVKGESRITPLGAFLRKYKLDELPELWNVLVGDMSLVGPRPDVPGYADHLHGEDRIILTIRPGITCLASLKYRNEEEILAQQPNPQEYNDQVIFPDKIRINKNYIKNRTFYWDLQIIFCTVLGKDLTKYY